MIHHASELEITMGRDSTGEEERGGDNYNERGKDIEVSQAVDAKGKLEKRASEMRATRAAEER